MNKTDYNKEMENILNNLTCKPKLLLHACCAPCSTSVLERLNKFFDITIFFYNPNMDTEEEFIKRQTEIVNLVNLLNKDENKIKVITTKYNHIEFLNKIKGDENEKEGGSRCEKCFYLRLTKTCLFAKENNYNYFTTTLSVSPYKNAEMLNKIGKELEEKYKVNFLVADFKKKDGYLNSIKLSKLYNLYRQDYCGCEFSKILKN